MEIHLAVFRGERIFAAVFLLHRVKRFSTMLVEAYLHFIIEIDLKKHHTLMKLYRNVFSITGTNTNTHAPRRYIRPL